MSILPFAPPNIFVAVHKFNSNILCNYGLDIFRVPILLLRAASPPDAPRNLCANPRFLLDKHSGSHYNTKAARACFRQFIFRGVAQMVARMVRDHEARGSNPRTPTKKTGLKTVILGSFFVLFCGVHFSVFATGAQNWCTITFLGLFFSILHIKIAAPL